MDTRTLAPTEPAAAALTAPDPVAWRDRLLAWIAAAAYIAARVPWHLVILLGLTIFAGVIRFARLDQPVLWGDEAMTFSRVSGSYRDLLDVLRLDGFPPLHYQIYWVLAQFTTLTPQAMRWIPAISGTLMVPAVYFLGRQLLSRRVALVAAAYAACSAWLMHYSRDAKMYMPLWLAVTLHMACLMWWFRTELRVAWLAWMASGLLAVGLHTGAFVVLALQPLYLLTQRRLHWRKTLLFVIGLAVVVAGPLGHYLGFSAFFERVNEDGWETSGLYWVEQVNSRRTGLDMLLSSGSNLVLDWQWVSSTRRGNWHPTFLVIYETTRTLLPVLLVLGLLPWKRWQVGRWLWNWLRSRTARSDAAERGDASVIRVDSGNGASRSPAEGNGAGSPSHANAPGEAPEPWWRAAFWVLAWLILPTYAFYCTSVKDFVSPYDWLADIGWMFNDRWGMLALLMGVTFALLLIRRVRVAAAWSVPLLLVACNAALLHGGYDNWVESMRLVRDWTMDPRILIAAAVVAAPAALLYCAPTWRGRLARAAMLSVVLVALFYLCVAIHKAFALRPPGALWHSRYVGVMWPAIALAISAALMRLPTWPLRWVAIIGFLGVNLAQAHWRVTGNLEPPIDRLAADLWAARDPDGPVCVYSNFGHYGGHIDGVQLMYYLAVESGIHPKPMDYQIAYYYRIPEARSAAWMRGRRMDSATILRTWLPANVFINTSDPRQVVSQVRSRPHARELIVWERTAARNADGPDALLRALGRDWQQAGEPEIIPLGAWNWDQRLIARRRHYVRLDPSS